MTASHGSIQGDLDRIVLPDSPSVLPNQSRPLATHSGIAT